LSAAASRAQTDALGVPISTEAVMALYWQANAAGMAVGDAVGAATGDVLGGLVGLAVGADGLAVGAEEGVSVGDAAGDCVGASVGTALGAVVGTAEGAVVGEHDPHSAGQNNGTSRMHATSGDRHNRGSVTPLHSKHVPHVPGQSTRNEASEQFAPLHRDWLSCTPAHSAMVGASVGDVVGDTVGDTVGLEVVGDAVGALVGDDVGVAVGAVVGVVVGGADPQLPHLPRQTFSMSVVEQGNNNSRQNTGSATALKHW
jgi:hypothetical protein